MKCFWHFIAIVCVCIRVGILLFSVKSNHTWPHQSLHGNDTVINCLQFIRHAAHEPKSTSNQTTCPAQCSYLDSTGVQYHYQLQTSLQLKPNYCTTQQMLLYSFAQVLKPFCWNPTFVCVWISIFELALSSDLAIM